MIVFNREEHLGSKAFVLMVLQRMILGFLLFLIAFILSVFQGAVISNALLLWSSNAGAGPATAGQITAQILGIIDALFAFSIVVMVGGLLLTVLEYVNYTYTVQEFDLKLKRGILHKEEVSIPYRQMQDINIDRIVLYRIFGVSRVVINSAGHEDVGEPSHTDVVLEPIEKLKAEGIRDFLQRKIGIQVVVTESQADKQAAAASKLR